MWFSHHSDCHKSVASLSDSLKCFPSLPSNWSWCENLSSASASRLYLHHPQVQVQFHSLCSSFSLLPIKMWMDIYIFLSSGQGDLPVLSWFSVTTSASEEVFLVHPWREMYSTFFYSSTILFTFLIVLKKKYISFFFFSWPHCAACRNLVPRSKIEPIPLAVEGQSLKYWTVREVHVYCIFNFRYCVLQLLLVLFLFSNFLLKSPCICLHFP